MGINDKEYLHYSEDQTCYIKRGATQIITDQGTKNRRSEETNQRRNEEKTKGGHGESKKQRNEERKCEY